MIKSVPFEIFEPGQTLFFNISRLAQFEKIMGTSLVKTLQENETGINFCLAGLMVGLKHHYPHGTQPFYEEKLDAFFENGGNLAEINVPIINAIMAVWGPKTDADTKNAPTAQKPESELTV